MFQDSNRATVALTTIDFLCFVSCFFLVLLLAFPLSHTQILFYFFFLSLPSVSFSFLFLFSFFLSFLFLGSSLSIPSREMTKETLKIALKASNLKNGTSKGS